MLCVRELSAVLLLRSVAQLRQSVEPNLPSPVLSLHRDRPTRLLEAPSIAIKLSNRFLLLSPCPLPISPILLGTNHTRHLSGQDQPLLSNPLVHSSPLSSRKASQPIFSTLPDSIASNSPLSVLSEMNDLYLQLPSSARLSQVLNEVVKVTIDPVPTSRTIARTITILLSDLHRLDLIACARNQPSRTKNFNRRFPILKLGRKRFSTKSFLTQLDHSKRRL